MNNASTDGQTNKFLADSYIPSIYQSEDNEIQQKVLMMWLYKLKRKSFYFYMIILSLWPRSYPGERIVLSTILDLYLPTYQI